MAELEDRYHTAPRYFLDPDMRELSVIDRILPFERFNPYHLPIVAEAAFDPISWLSIERPQLCFKDGPIERTGLMRWPGIWGQVSLHSSLGRDDEEVEAAFVQDYVYDILHRAYSHSSDFLIQSFLGSQDAHDDDAPSILRTRKFMQHALERGLLDYVLPQFVKAGYPDFNIDRLEFGLRQMDMMQWFNQRMFSTGSHIKKLLAVEDEQIVATNHSFAKHFTAGFAYLGSENWLNPIHRAALLVQQYDLKDRTSDPNKFGRTDFFVPKGQRRGAFSHPYDKLYDAERTTEYEHMRVDGDRTATDLNILMRSLIAVSQARGRVSAIGGRLADAYLGNSHYDFIGPLDESSDELAVPLGMTIQKNGRIKKHEIKYVPGTMELHFYLPGGMKARSLDPMLDNGARVSEQYDEFAELKGKFEQFSRMGHVVTIHGVKHDFGMRLMEELEEVGQRYEEALKRPRLEPEIIGEVVADAGRAAMSMVTHREFIPPNTHFPRINSTEALQFEILDGNKRFNKLLEAA